MDRIDHTVKFYEREDAPYDCRIVAKMDNPPVEGCGKDICDALSVIATRLVVFLKAFTKPLTKQFETNLTQTYD